MGFVSHKICLANIVYRKILKISTSIPNLNGMSMKKGNCKKRNHTYLPVTNKFGRFPYVLNSSDPLTTGLALQSSVKMFVEATI